ncbi:MAG: ABC transporter substrate-binding protein [Anaerolineae bacterium]|nr:ABC transporter substrate-binding protein [Anaerolineae bacterium]
MKRTTVQWLSMALVIALLAALSLGVVQAQEEQVLVVGHRESTDFYDPARGYTQTTGIVLRSVYETLVTFPDGDTTEILPALATDWTLSEDGLTWTFNLRSDAVFSSGNPVTAQDVAFSFNRVKNVGSSPAGSPAVANMAGATAIDADTVEVKLNAIDPAFLVGLTANWFAVSEAAVVTANGGTDAADAATTDTAGDYLDQNSAGSGPYMLAGWEKTVQTVLVRNPNYSGEAPFFDRIIIQNLEPAAQKAALEAGEIDIALDLTSDQMAGMNPEEISIFRGPGNLIHFLIMNNNPDVGGPVANPLVQQAIRLALDYEGYKALWGGLQPAANMPIGIAGALPESAALARDLEAARALMAEAGYADGFEITMDYWDSTFQGVSLGTNAQKIAADLAEIGITVNLSPGEIGPKLEAYRNGTQVFGYWFWGPDIEDPSDFLSFLPGGKVAKERALWMEDTVSQELLDMIAAAKVELNPERRLELYGELQLANQQNSPFAPFNQPDIQTAYRANLQGYVWHPVWLVNLSLLSRSS